MKLVHLVGFIIKKFVTMYGHVNFKKRVFIVEKQSTGSAGATSLHVLMCIVFCISRR